MQRFPRVALFALWCCGTITWTIVAVRCLPAGSPPLFTDIQKQSILTTTGGKTPSVSSAVLPAHAQRVHPATPQNTADVLPAVKTIGNQKSSMVEPLPAQPLAVSSEPQFADTCININTADATILVRLPGIGPVLAQRIIEFRRQNGSFQTVSDLVRIKGIGEKKMEKLHGKACL